MSKLLFLCLMIGVASAATFIGKVESKPAHLEHKQGCYVKEVNDVIPYGTDIAPIGKDCVRIECRNGDWLDYATCGDVFTDNPNCHKTELNLNKPYPDCCPTFKCDTENRV